MPPLDRTVRSPGIASRLAGLLKARRTAGKPPYTQVDLAARAGLSRQTIATILSSERISRAAAEKIAEALDTHADELAPELAPRLGFTNGTTRRLADVPSLLKGQRVRVWLADFRAELTKAGALDDEIEAAVALVTAPDVFTYFAGGRAQDFGEREAIEAMESIAEVVRRRLKKLGRRTG